MVKSLSAPKNATACLIFQDQTVLWGYGFGAFGQAIGEICFNTAMSGYQEILTDPSYSKQIITFTCPHIGNIGINDKDMESHTIHAQGLIVRNDITMPSNWRSQKSLTDWLSQHNVIGIHGIDTRALTQRIRDNGAENVLIAYPESGTFDFDTLFNELNTAEDMAGLDLAKTVSCQAPYTWCEPTYNFEDRPQRPLDKHVVVIDYGVKHNILRMLVDQGCHLTVVPCSTSAQEIMDLQPDGILLSNGPGDPAATGQYAVPIIQDLLAHNIPIFGICLGHQLLALALGGKTQKLEFGHRGANHPVKNLATGLVEITSQNHGFVVLPDSLPEHVEQTHISLFDGTNEGLKLTGKPVFSVQHHPEASPGPQDSYYLFEQFLKTLSHTKQKAA